MGIINEKANKIASDMEANNVEKRLAFDPMLIITLIGIIINIVKIYQQCKNTPKEAAVSMRSGGILERWRLRKVIRQHIDDPEMHEHVGSQMFGSTLKISSQLEDDEVQQMYDQVNKEKP